MAIDLLADIFQKSLFDPAELKKEKLVILQEINMLEDTPDEYIHDFFGENFWDAHPLAMPILGTRESIKRFQRENIIDFFSERYSGNNLVVSAAGNLKHDLFVKLVRKAFGSLNGTSAEKSVSKPEVSSKIAVREKDLEQTHVVIGSLAPSAASTLRYTAFLMNTILGGSMSSRLFQEIREKRGLAYSIHSFLVPYEDVGMLGIYFGTGEDRMINVIKLVVEELKKLCDKFLPEQEIQSAREQMKGHFLLSMESTDVRMTRLARNEICFKRNIGFDEVVDNIDAISKEGVMNMACDMFRPEILSMAVLGRTPKEDITADLLH